MSKRCESRYAIGRVTIRCERPPHDEGWHLHRERSGYLQHWDDTRYRLFALRNGRWVPYIDTGVVLYSQPTAVLLSNEYERATGTRLRMEPEEPITNVPRRVPA